MDRGIYVVRWIEKWIDKEMAEIIPYSVCCVRVLWKTVRTYVSNDITISHNSGNKEKTTNSNSLLSAIAKNRISHSIFKRQASPKGRGGELFDPYL